MSRKKQSQPVQKTTLDRFFKIQGSLDDPGRNGNSKQQGPKQQKLDLMFNKRSGPTLRSQIRKGGTTDSATDAIDRRLRTDRNLVDLMLDEEPEKVFVIKDSSEDSDSDLDDPDSILGFEVKPGDDNSDIKLPPSLSDSEDSSGSRPIVEILTPTRPSFVSRKPGYTNSLESLVKAKNMRKYDLRKLEDTLAERKPREGDENDGSSSESEYEVGLLGLDESDIERIKNQLGNSDTKQVHVELELFEREADNTSEIAFTERLVTLLESIESEKSTNSLERLFQIQKSFSDPLKFIFQLFRSNWLHSPMNSQGSKLTKPVGDLLLHIACFCSSDSLAQNAFLSLCAYLDTQMSTWSIDFATFASFVNSLYGKRLDSPKDLLSLADWRLKGANNSEAQIEEPESTVHVFPRERMSYLAYAAASALGFLSVDHTCQVISLLVDVLMDQRTGVVANEICKSIKILIESVSPASKWTLIWPECIKMIGKRYSGASIEAQLQLVESLPSPSNSTRSRQLRRNLALYFLKFEQNDRMETGGEVYCSTSLPEQLQIRVIGEILDTSSVYNIIGSSEPVDYVSLRCSIELLGHVLDNPRAMQSVRDETKSIYEKLGILNRRISDDSNSGNIDKTLAKDSVQMLRVRIFMTALVGDRHRDLLYGNNNLMDWLAGRLTL